MNAELVRWVLLLSCTRHSPSLTFGLYFLMDQRSGVKGGEGEAQGGVGPARRHPICGSEQYKKKIIAGNMSDNSCSCRSEIFKKCFPPWMCRFMCNSSGVNEGEGDGQAKWSRPNGAYYCCVIPNIALPIRGQSCVCRQPGGRIRRAMPVCNLLDEFGPRPPYSLCVPLPDFEETGSEIRFRGCVVLVLYIWAIFRGQLIMS